MTFEYGEYEKFYADERTKRALVALDELAKKLGVVYGLIGGLAAYLYVNRPPHDEPDIDLMIYAVEPARDFVKVLSKMQGFKLNLFDDQDDAVFAHLRFEKEIQIDILTSLDEMAARPTNRINGVEVEPVEVLIVEKMIRATKADVRMALDLLAFAPYSRECLFEIVGEYSMGPALSEAGGFAKRMERGSATNTEIEAMAGHLAEAD